MDVGDIITVQDEEEKESHKKEEFWVMKLAPEKRQLKKADACHVKQKAYLCTVWSRRSNEYVDGSDDDDDDDEWART